MRIKNYTPVFDKITKELDPLASLVFGRIWRYSQMEHGHCEASLQTLAIETGISVDTVRRRIETLMEADYLSEKKYEIGKTRKLTPNYDVMITSELVRVAESNDPPSTELPQPPAESRTKIDIKDRKKNYAEAIQRGAELSTTIQLAFQEHLGLTPNWNTKSSQACYQFFRERYQAGQTVKEFADWWASNWKGKDGNLPSSLNQVQTLWLQAFTKTEEEHDYIKAL